MSEPLRILVVLPMYGGSLPVGQYCIQALRDLGHTVACFDAPDFHGSFSALKNLGVTSDRLEQLEGGFLQVISQAIQAQVETFEPDLVLALAQAPMSRPLLRRLLRAGIATAMWFVEDHKIFTYWRAFAPLYDVFAVIQREPFFSELQAVGQQHVLYLPMAALPQLHAPRMLTAMEARQYGADVGFLGAGYPNRRMAFRALTHLDFKIWGTEWEGESLLQRHVQQGGARIDPETCVTIYNATRINLNLHSSVQSKELVPHGDFVNPRTFELASIGAFQLVDERELMPELFDEGALATFRNAAEMQEKIVYYLNRPEERAAMTARARQCVLARHTYQHRMQSLLDYVGSVRSKGSPWPPARRRDAMPPELPEELRQGLRDLLRQLQLPEDAPFEDVLGRVRLRTGVLTDLETSLLFLDEWRKQYVK